MDTLASSNEEEVPKSDFEARVGGQTLMASKYQIKEERWQESKSPE
jgi:hypothetical protein